MNLNVIKSDYENLKNEFEDYKEKTDIKIKNLNKNNQNNIKNITSNENAIKDIERINNGEDIDTSKACESDPKLC